MGGVVGGIVVIALIVIIIVVLTKRKNVRENVDLPNPAFDPSSDPPPPISPKGRKASKLRAQSVSGDPNVDASLHRVAATGNVAEGVSSDENTYL